MVTSPARLVVVAVSCMALAQAAVMHAPAALAAAPMPTTRPVSSSTTHVLSLTSRRLAGHGPSSPNLRLRPVAARAKAGDVGNRFNLDTEQIKIAREHYANKATQKLKNRWTRTFHACLYLLLNLSQVRDAYERQQPIETRLEDFKDQLGSLTTLLEAVGRRFQLLDADLCSGVWDVLDNMRLIPQAVQEPGATLPVTAEMTVLGNWLYDNVKIEMFSCEKVYPVRDSSVSYSLALAFYLVQYAKSENMFP